MGFDYFIRIDCAIQKPRKDVEFVQRAKIGAYANLLKNMAESGQPQPKNLVTPFPIKTLMGARAEISVPDLMDTWHRIERKTLPICRDCPSNFDGGAFGCWGSIDYPISLQGEQWLINNLTSSGSSYLVHHIEESGVDGQRLDAQRAEPSAHPDGGGMLSLLLPPGPAEKIVEDRRITSSMIIDYLLGCQPHLEPMTLFGLLDDYDAIDADSTTKFMAQTRLFMGNDEIAGSLFANSRFALEDHSSDDKSVRQIKLFLKACYSALVTNGKMMIDG